MTIRVHSGPDLIGLCLGGLPHRERLSFPSPFTSTSPAPLLLFSPVHLSLGVSSGYCTHIVSAQSLLLHGECWSGRLSLPPELPNFRRGEPRLLTLESKTRRIFIPVFSRVSSRHNGCQCPQDNEGSQVRSPLHSLCLLLLRHRMRCSEGLMLAGQCHR